MKKKIFGGIAFAAVVLAIAFNLGVKQDGNKLSALAMANVEALAQDESLSNSSYFITDKDCSISERIDANLEITIAGKKFKVGNGTVGGTYTRTWKSAARDCTSGGKSNCTTYTCGQFYSTLSSL